MTALDCESRESTLDSLSVIYGVSASDIKKFLREADLEKHYATTNPQNPCDKELTSLFEQTFDSAPGPIHRVFWFHLTRAKLGAGFVNGILPLSEALDDIWETIFAVFKGTNHEIELRNLQQNGVPGHLYDLKVGNPLHGGPYAMLVRESAFRLNEMGSHDYLRLPEIIDDICNGYKETCGHDIHDELSKALVPYIVKFWSNEENGKLHIEPALYYLYCIMQGQELTDIANTCFDGKNSAVPPEQIVKVDAL